MIQDGKYNVYRTYDSKKTKIGSFSVKDSSVVFDDEKQELTIDKIPAGPISKRTAELIQSIMNGKHNSLDIEKV
jgi:hypothetical protein